LCILAALDQVALHHAATPAQVALAWLMARPGIAAPIASATSLDQLQDLIAAARLRLEPSDIEKLDWAGKVTAAA
jgi:aryl-alcohol dehydrogenase-like predicted oxidoreductase